MSMVDEVKRTKAQDGRECVLDGHNLYVTPDRFAAMRRVINDPFLSADDAAMAAAKTAGLTDDEVSGLIRSGQPTAVIVDYSLAVMADAQH